MKIRRKRLAAPAFLCALAASLVIAVAPAAAEFLGPAPIRNLDEGGMIFPEVTGTEAAEEYPSKSPSVKNNFYGRSVQRRSTPITPGICRRSR
jgi:hypothetical protein